VTTREATHEDHLRYLELCLAFNRSDLAGPHLQGLLKAAPADPDYLRLQVRMVRGTGSPAEAIVAAREWVRARPEDPEALFALGTSKTGSTIEEERARAAVSSGGSRSAKDPSGIHRSTSWLPAPSSTTRDATSCWSRSPGAPTGGPRS